MPIIYFSDNSSTVPDHVQTLLRGNHVGREIAQNGPNGGGGAIFGDADYWNDRPFGLDPKKHQFTKIADIWYCLAHADYQPKDFAKAEQVGGESVRLGDHAWIIPKVSELPRVVSLNSSGEWTLSAVRKEHRPFYDAAQHVWKQIVEGKLTNQEMWNFCCTALAVNYRIGKPEVGLLQLLDESSGQDIIRVALGIRGKDDGDN